MNQVPLLFKKPQKTSMLIKANNQKKRFLQVLFFVKYSSFIAKADEKEVHSFLHA
jgi:hypothetical protein